MAATVIVANSTATSPQTRCRLAVSATEPIVAPFISMGTMVVTCRQSAIWRVPLASRGWRWLAAGGSAPGCW